MTSVLLTDSDRFSFGVGEVRMLADAGAHLELLPGHNRDAIAAAAATATAIFVYSGKFDAELIGRLGPCRLLARCGTGYDNIDVAAARTRSVAVSYVPAYGADDVAEHAIALLLACARRLGRADCGVQAGTWPSYGELGPMRRLRRQILGLLGFGRIAREVAARGRGVQLRVIAHDPFVDPAAGAALGVELVPIETLLAESDFLSVHCR
jgi:D-3-phosphoglycerate dehydrogenase / 2-oxoglutarate reductase